MPGVALNSKTFPIDNFSEKDILRTRQMISGLSIPSMYPPIAKCAGLQGNVWNFTVTHRTWLAISRKEDAARPDELVIG